MRFLPLALLLALLVPTRLLSAETALTLETIRYPVRLYLQKDYYRTISEILRLEFVYPDQKRIRYLRPYLAKSHFHLNEFDQALHIAEDTLRNGSRYSKSVREELASLATVVLLKRGDDLKAKSLWEREIKGEPDPAFPLESRVRGRIDPGRARLYSALLPGSGLLLSKEYGKATVSFLLNGLFIAGCYSYARKEQWGTAGLLLFFEIGWYKGGIRAAEESAVNYNDRLTKLYQNEWISQNIGEIR